MGNCWHQGGMLSGEGIPSGERGPRPRGLAVPWWNESVWTAYQVAPLALENPGGLGVGVDTPLAGVMLRPRRRAVRPAEPREIPAAVQAQPEASREALRPRRRRFWHPRGDGDGSEGRVDISWVYGLVALVAYCAVMAVLALWKLGELVAAAVRALFGLG